MVNRIVSSPTGIPRCRHDSNLVRRAQRLHAPIGLRDRIVDLIEERSPIWLESYNYRSNNQLRAELNLFYDHSEKFNIVGGVELRYSSIGAKNIESSEPPAAATSSVCVAPK